jgi:nucleotide-binding universal stress UspA family protein
MKRFSNILLVVDEGVDCSAALERAVTLARNNQARLTIATVVDEMPDDMQTALGGATPVAVRDTIVAEKRDWVEEVATSGRASGVSLATKVLVGKTFIEIIRQVLRNDHDLIIKSAEVAGGLRNLLFGSTDMHLMRKCPCPVWLIKPTENRKYRRILAAVDRDEEEPVKDVLNRQILEISTSLALAEFSEIHIVHAWDLVGEDLYRSVRSGVSHAEVNAMLEEKANARRHWLESLLKNYGAAVDKDVVDYLEPKLHVVKGRAKHIVPLTARELDVDLIVMGTVSRAGIAGFLMGNTAENILAQIDCSVLTMKPPGFVSPVALEV